MPRWFKKHKRTIGIYDHLNNDEKQKFDTYLAYLATRSSKYSSTIYSFFLTLIVFGGFFTIILGMLWSILLIVSSLNTVLIMFQTITSFLLIGILFVVGFICLYSLLFNTQTNKKINQLFGNFPERINEINRKLDGLK